jgi:hypothetical protein
MVLLNCKNGTERLSPVREERVERFGLVLLFLSTRSKDRVDDLILEF